MEEIRLALISSRGRPDGLTKTILDGIHSLHKDGHYKIDLKISGVPESEFIAFAKNADLILLVWGKDNTDIELAEKIGAWNKTFFIDGSEMGRNKRLHSETIEEISKGSYKGRGAIWFDLFRKCAGYFRREPPYLAGIIPLPFGIESAYIKYKKGVKKDIDFVCIFGQEDYPPLRKAVRQEIEKFCKENNFSCRTEQTKLPFFGIQSRLAKNRFYSLLARAKVGVSVSGGGFDTFRFWEVLGNNCILLTDSIGIYPRESHELDYKRIWQFSDIDDFKHKLNTLGRYLKEEYNLEDMGREYADVLAKHSSKARVLTILDEARRKGLIQ